MQDQAQIKHIGFIGVGRMGGPMALNLHRAGFVVRAYDLSAPALDALAAAGLAVAYSPAEAANRADAIILMLPNDDALREILEAQGGLLEHLRPGQVVVDMSSSMLATSQRVAAAVARRGAAMLDAPVSGGEAGAQAGTLSIMVGGDAAALERCRPVLAAMGGTITHIGGNGMGLVAKYVNQMLMEASFCVIAEAFALAAKAGADLDAIYQAVRNGLGGSRVLDQMMPQLLSDNFGAGRELTLHYKDGAYALAASQSLGGWAPITELTHDLFAKALAAGQGNHSAAAVSRIYEQRLGVRLAGERPGQE